MVIPPMMMSQHQLPSANQELICIAIRLSQGLLNLHIQSHLVTNAELVLLWALSLSMTQSQWPCLTTAPKHFALTFLEGPPMSLTTVLAQQAPVQMHLFKEWTYSVKCPRCFQLRQTS